MNQTRFSVGDIVKNTATEQYGIVLFLEQETMYRCTSAELVYVVSSKFADWFFANRFVFVASITDDIITK